MRHRNNLFRLLSMGAFSSQRRFSRDIFKIWLQTKRLFDGLRQHKTSGVVRVHTSSTIEAD